VRTKYQEQRERLRRKWLEPASLEFTKLDFSDRITDQILESPFDRMSIGTNPETKYLITKNEIHRSLAYQMVWDGKRWIPHRLTTVFAETKRIRYSKSVSASTVETVWDSGIQTYGTLRQLDLRANFPDLYFHIYVDDLRLDISTGTAGFYVALTPAGLHDIGGESSLFKLGRYDEVNNDYRIFLKREIKWTSQLRIEVENKESSAYTMGVVGILEFSPHGGA